MDLLSKQGYKPFPAIYNKITNSYRLSHNKNKQLASIATNVCLTNLQIKKLRCALRNFSVSTAFTKTEEVTESPSAGVTFIADHPLLFSVLVKDTARCKWRVAVVPQFVDLMTLLFLQWCSHLWEDFCTYKIQDCVYNYVC